MAVATELVIVALLTEGGFHPHHPPIPGQGAGPSAGGLIAKGCPPCSTAKGSGTNSKSCSEIGAL